MAGETYIDGSAVMLSIWDTDAYEPVACLTSNGLSEALSLRETRTKCNAGKVVRKPDAYTYEIPLEGIYIDEAVDAAKQSHRKLSGYMRNKTKITWRISTGITSPTHEYGYGYITALDLTGPADDDATFTATISGTEDDISSTDPNV